jgi:hypothetical protein
VIDGVHGELLAEACCVFAERQHLPPDGGHMLADREIGPLNEHRVDAPVVYLQRTDNRDEPVRRYSHGVNKMILVSPIGLTKPG